MENNSSDNLEIQEWRKRLRFLADIIFASAMTIMIFNIEIPEFGHISDTKELAAFLLKQLNSMWVFFIAFVVISVYWMKHLEHFSAILIVNQTFMWFFIFKPRLVGYCLYSATTSIYGKEETGDYKIFQAEKKQIIKQ